MKVISMTLRELMVLVRERDVLIDELARLQAKINVEIGGGDEAVPRDLNL